MLLEKCRLLQHGGKTSDDPADSMLVSTVSTLADLHVDLSE